MNGLFCINKPIGMTSFDVVAILRKKLNIKKIGHTGTLDPNASGLMIILVGNATKLLPFIVHQSKVYEGQMKFGFKTTTADIWGEVIEKGDIKTISQDEVDKVTLSFLGHSKQIPPMVSAISVDGKRLYEYARQGIEIEREARDIEIYDLKAQLIEDGLAFKAHVSSGTYIRVLCEDIAKKFGMLASLSQLNRIQIENINLEQALNLDDVSYDTIQWLDPLSLINYNQVIVDDPTLFYHGKRFEYEYSGDRISIVYQAKLLAIYEYDKELKNYKSLRGLW